ncbi:MAG: carbamoyltransferase HypF [Phycisphaerales bacterium]|nr:carbamoyltransferase HypF [Phycisphaerales bacterium]
MIARRIHVSGVVQGVGFRPWVWQRAASLGLVGWVRNSSSGVEIHAEGDHAAIEAMLASVAHQPPPLAAIESVTTVPADPSGASAFVILDSLDHPGGSLPVAPDIAVCDDCLREMHDPADRRYRYPFINCTNCGPRFSIVLGIPYDRANTTMGPFRMCPECRAQYDDPSNRRFHAQPIACPGCGPQAALELNGRVVARREDAIARARSMLAEGLIVAIKGLGGFHLACDATDTDAVARLRSRKRREQRPFALMCRDAATVFRFVPEDPRREAILRSPERPIVLFPAIDPGAIAPGVAPGRAELGFMLAYTPLHHLLLEPAGGFPDVLVMTSANLSDEPIAYEDDDARRRLAPLADALLVHDRPIRMRTDDSVVTAFEGRRVFLRRSRGFAPLPVALPLDGPPTLAFGADMKNAFCLTRERHAFISHHIGEMGTVETERAFEDAARHFERLFRVHPHRIAHDLHPDYASTRAALARAGSDHLPAVAVQHHHAHAASCMADNAIPPDRRAIGVIFDGTGYGTDGKVWGGEFLLCSYASFERAMQLRYSPLPGGDAAARRPYRGALAALRAAGIPWDHDIAAVRAATLQELEILEGQLNAGINTPDSSSMGRLFDAFASLLGICHRADHEGQAPCLLESAARSSPTDDTAYEFAIDDADIDPSPALRAAVRDLRRGVDARTIALRFHRGVAAMVTACCRRLRDEHGIGTVALSGGVWQNTLLMELAVPMLRAHGFTTLIHYNVPANDGGIALGQACVAHAVIAAAPHP